MVFVACAASAACGFNAPSVPDGGGGDDADAPAAELDRDGDGVGDTADLCPDIADPQQRDHDNDRRGDACDRCPHLADPTDPDQDSDDVGDACDPAPGAAGDRRVLWIGFYPEDQARIDDPAQWRDFGASWTIVDGWVRITASGIQVLRPLIDLQRAALSSRIRLDNVTGNTAAGLNAGMVYSGSNLDQLYQCVIFRSQTRIGARSYLGGNQSDQYTTWPGTIGGGLTVDVRSRLTGNMYECTFAAPPTTARVISGVTAGLSQLIVQDATASYDYLFIVEQGS